MHQQQLHDPLIIDHLFWKRQLFSMLSTAELAPGVLYALQLISDASLFGNRMLFLASTNCRLGKRCWYSETSSAVVEFPPQCHHDNGDNNNCIGNRNAGLTCMRLEIDEEDGNDDHCDHDQDHHHDPNQNHDYDPDQDFGFWSCSGSWPGSGLRLWSGSGSGS